MYRQKWCKYIDSVFPYFPQGNVLQEHSGISKPECWQWYSPYLIFICSLVPFFSRAPLPPSLISCKFQVPQTMDLHPPTHPPPHPVCAGHHFWCWWWSIEQRQSPWLQGAYILGRELENQTQSLFDGSEHCSQNKAGRGSGIWWWIGAARLRRVSGKKGFTGQRHEESEGAKPRGLCRETEGPSPRGRVPAVFEE